MISLLLATQMALPLKSPTTNAGCFAAPERVGTDNVPIGNGVPTSVVNIWGFLKPGTRTATAWIYKNGLGDYYLQFNHGADVTFAEGNKGLKRFLVRKQSKGNYPFVKVSPQQLVDIENLMLSYGMARFGCFTQDYNLQRR